jgi:hypothetical protein
VSNEFGPNDDDAQYAHAMLAGEGPGGPEPGGSPMGDFYA